MNRRLEALKPLDGDLHPATGWNLARAFRALGDEWRLQIISCLLADTPLCVGDFQKQLGISQPLASHHLYKLVDAGILERSKSGRRTWYWISEGALERLSAVLVGRLP